MISDSPAVFEFVSKDPRNKVAYAREQLVGGWIDSIHEAMRVQDVSQAEIARRVKLSRAAVSKVLRAPANVKVDTLVRIGLAVGLAWEIEPQLADPALWLFDTAIPPRTDTGRVEVTFCWGPPAPEVAAHDDAGGRQAPSPLAA